MAYHLVASLVWGRIQTTKNKAEELFITTNLIETGIFFFLTSQDPRTLTTSTKNELIPHCKFKVGRQESNTSTTLAK